ncbi:MAG: glycine--tRNA ligase subunit beta [Gammaproteobacteria bacterium]|nr:MAG: glycine--tRNA ligase subunit beta [Gammaproteobacteria bacterium]
MSTLLIELGVAELPTAAVETLSQAFLDGMKRVFDDHHIAYAGARRFATARRLAVQFEGLADRQTDQTIEKRGPALKVAKNSDGKWTKAAIGFAASCGVRPDDLVSLKTAKGQWLFYRGVEKGQASITLIPALFRSVVDDLPIAKRMRWGDRSDSFVRPVVSFVMLMDDKVIKTELFGIPSGRTTIGHRFHGDKTLTITTASAYENILADSYVVADIDKRRDMIIEQVTHLADNIANISESSAVISDNLLEQVNALVEYPVAILGQFNPRYLHIPQEVLIKTMQDNQKYFPVVDGNDAILPYFVTVANIESTHPDVVRTGNQRVIEPRFADAEFFWENDKKKTLASRRNALKKVVYQEKLGSIYDRSERIAKIAHFIADLAAMPTKNAVRAAQLAKCDLISEMVFEFGELQGIIGQYYAQNDGENAEVAAAIREQYLPKFAGDKLPETETGLVLSLADKIENIIGGFTVGAKPTGTKDPYALRRACLGVIRLLNETRLDLSLEVILDFAVETFADELNASVQLKAIKTYIRERLKGYYLDKGNRHDIFEAVMAINPPKLSDFTARLTALNHFVGHEASDNLFAVNKRIGNILKKSHELTVTVDDNLFAEDQEKWLFDAGQKVKTNVTAAVKKGQYETALETLATLRQPLDDFFDHVMVMTDDETIKVNRLTLLAEIRNLFMQVADFSLINASV